jgi:integrase
MKTKATLGRLMPILPPRPPTMKYVQWISSRGRWYGYFRTKTARYPLPDYHGNRGAFHQAYGQLLQEFGNAPTAARVKANSVADYGQRYIASQRFRDLAKNTQNNYRRRIEYLIEDYGDKPMGRLTERAVHDILEQNERSANVVNGMVKMLGLLAKRAVADGVLKRNPTPHVERRQVKTKHKEPWPLSELEKFRARWPIGTKQRLAVELGFATGQRGVDVVAARWTDFEGDEWNCASRKVHIDLTLVVTNQLSEAMEAMERDGPFLVGTSKGARSAGGFYNWFRQAADKAGMDCRYTFHGLRATAAVMAIESGCTEDEAMALTGHESREEFARYVKRARQKVLARAAAKKIEGATGVSSVN